MKVRSRFKGLHLIDRVPDELWTKVCTGDREWDHPQEKEMQKSKMALWGGLTNSCEKKGIKKQRRKVFTSECTVPKNSKGEIKQTTSSSAINAKK